jgi:hypothetical protein
VIERNGRISSTTSGPGKAGLTGVDTEAVHWITMNRAYDDAAGGTGKDSYALVVSHTEPDGSEMIDAVRERKPRFVPAQVIGEYAALLQELRHQRGMGR